MTVISLRGPMTFQSDALLGFRYRPGLNIHRVREGCDWHFTTDNSGRRVTPGNPMAGIHPTIALVGDSFAFSDGVNDDETLAAALAQRGFHVVNLGVTGYGPHQQLLSLRAYLAGNPPPDWIVALTYTNDATDVLSSYQSMHHQPHASLVSSHLELAPYKSPLSDELTDRSYLCAIIRALFFNQSVRHDADGPAVVAACLEQIAGEARRVGAGCLILAHDAANPSQIQPVVCAAMDRGVAVTDLTPLFVDGIESGRDLICPDGSHWNRAGNSLVAEAIVDRITAPLDSLLSTDQDESLRLH